MNRILINGDTGKRELTETVLAACARYGGAVMRDGSMLTASCEAPAFYVICTDSLPESDGGSIVVFGEHPHISEKAMRLNGTVAVIDSRCTEAVSGLFRCPVPVIGCSMSPYDTLSISGRQDDDVLVCLQRSVQRMDGKWLEPCEIGVKAFSETPVFPILAACAVLLLSAVPFEQGYSLL